MQETILQLSGAVTQQLISAEVPKSCRAYRYSLDGEKYLRKLISDTVRQRDGASERVQLMEDRGERATTHGCQLTRQRSDHAILLSTSQAKASFATTVCLDVIKEAGARATAVLK
ncbi:hypothetical protein ABZ914_03860 [Spirillospora sp. NPDC046719]